ncbi:MAG: DUF6600 domain-containing protein [Syntrophorhabdaceae bacterium]
MKRPHITASCLAIIMLVLGLAPFGHAADPDMIYIRYIEGNVNLAESGSGQWMEAAVNTPLIEGDIIQTGPTGRAELFLKDGSLVRIGKNSTMKVLAVESKGIQLKLDTGMAHIVSRGSNGVPVFVNTPTAALDMTSPTVSRIDAYDGGVTEISVYNGNLFVAQSSGRMAVSAGQRLVLKADGSMPVMGPLRASDDWYAWNLERDRATDTSGSNEGDAYLPEELRSYSSDLNANGQWVYTPEYQYVWVPTVITVGIWSPYRFGRWAWIRGNYVWVGYEPWGWAPYHYGRWTHHDRAGWCWVPPRRGHVKWEPAHVAWVHSSRQIGWVPLAPGENYDRRHAPVIHQTNAYNTYKNVTIQKSLHLAAPTYRNAAVASSLVMTERNEMLRQKRTSVNVPRPGAVPLKTVSLPAGVTPAHQRNVSTHQSPAASKNIPRISIPGPVHRSGDPAVRPKPVGPDKKSPNQPVISSGKPIPSNLPAAPTGQIHSRPLDQRINAARTGSGTVNPPANPASSPDHRTVLPSSPGQSRQPIRGPETNPSVTTQNVQTSPSRPAGMPSRPINSQSNTASAQPGEKTRPLPAHPGGIIVPPAVKNTPTAPIAKPAVSIMPGRPQRPVDSQNAIPDGGEKRAPAGMSSRPAMKAPEPVRQGPPRIEQSQTGRNDPPRQSVKPATPPALKSSTSGDPVNSRPSRPGQPANGRVPSPVNISSPHSPPSAPNGHGGARTGPDQQSDNQGQGKMQSQGDVPHKDRGKK